MSRLLVLHHMHTHPEMKEAPKGLLCPLVTPLKKGDILDEAALDHLIDYVGGHVDILVLGDPVWGEGFVLDREVRLALYCATLEIVQGRWPLFMTLTTETGAESRDIMAHVESFADRLHYPGRIHWFDYPLYYHSNRGLPQWYESLGHETEYPFILGNNPGIVKKRKGTVQHKNIRTGVLKKLSHLETIVGLVDTGAFKRSMNYHRAVRHRRDFSFYDGDERVFISRPSSSGVMAGGSNVAPESWHRITRACMGRIGGEKGHVVDTDQLMATAAMLKDLESLYGKNPAGVMKRMLHVMGILPHAGTAFASEPTSAEQNCMVEDVLTKYQFV